MFIQVNPRFASRVYGQDSRAALAAGVMICAADGRVLLVKRSPDSSHGDTWAFVGGAIEDGENARQAARRECREEIGYTPDKLNAVGYDNPNFSLFRHDVDKNFQPQLNDEHTDSMWADLAELPSPLHPGVATALEKHGRTDHPVAYDRAASVRSYDQDGRLKISLSHISKANVCRYLGSEIPDSEELGLHPNRFYRLLRDPEELKKGADSFNNVPILNEHKKVTAANHLPDHVIGATGTDAEFEYPYLDNSAVIWVASEIRDIEHGRKMEWSCCYAYKADMTPGEFEGEKYDGVMRDIKANHVALVKAGRAGSDVVVGDSKPTGELIMSKKMSMKARVAQGALIAFLTPRLAADAKLDLTTVLSNIGKDFDLTKIEADIKKAVEGRLAKDETISDVTELLKTLKPAADDIEEMDDDDDEAMDSPVEAMCNMLKEKGMDEATINSVKEMFKKPAKDKVEPVEPVEPAKDDEDDKKPMVTKEAMDEAIEKAEQRTAKRFRSIDEARLFVKPWVGALPLAFDSADAVYSAALDVLGVKHKDVHPSAYRPLIEAKRKLGEREQALAEDHAVEGDGYSKRFPNADRIGTV